MTRSGAPAIPLIGLRTFPMTFQHNLKKPRRALQKFFSSFDLRNGRMDGFAEYSDSEGEEGGDVNDTLLPPAPVALAESDDEDEDDDKGEAAAQAPAAAAAEPSAPQEPVEKKRKLLPNPLDAMSTVGSPHHRTRHPDPQRRVAWKLGAQCSREHCPRLTISY